MPDDMKMAIDIGADLTKLDGTLSMALQKVQVAGQRMQQAMTIAPQVGGSYGAMSPLASANTGQNMAGHQVSFGGGLNASSLLPQGNPWMQGMMTPLAGTPAPTLPGQSMIFGGGLNARAGNGQALPGVARGGNGMIASLFADSKYGRLLASAGPLGIAAAAYGAGVAGSSARANIDNGAYNLGAAIDNRRDPILRNQYLGSAIDSVRNLPFGLGTLAGNEIDSDRRLLRGMGFTNLGADPGQNSSTHERAEQLRAKNQAGFKGGGYTGQLKEQAYGLSITLPRELARMKVEGASAASINDFKKQSEQAAYRTFTEISFDRSQELQDIGSFTKQNRLSAMGLGKFADLEEINRSYRTRIATLKRQGNDPQMLAAVQGEQKSAITAAMMGNIGPAQAIANPGDVALGGGSVRLGSTRNQSDAYLRQIADNTSEAPVAVVAR